MCLEACSALHPSEIQTPAVISLVTDWGYYGYSLLRRRGRTSLSCGRFWEVLSADFNFLLQLWAFNLLVQTAFSTKSYVSVVVCCLKYKNAVFYCFRCLYVIKITYWKVYFFSLKERLRCNSAALPLFNMHRSINMQTVPASASTSTSVACFRLELSVWPLTLQIKFTNLFWFHINACGRSLPSGLSTFDVNHHVTWQANLG